MATAEAYLCTKWHLDLSGRLATIHGPKIGGCAPVGEVGAGSPPNTMWEGLRATSVQSFILIHPTVWPQYTNATDRQIDRTEKQDNGTIAQGERFYKRLAQKWVT